MVKRWRVVAGMGVLVSGIALACGPGFLDGISGGIASDGGATLPDATASDASSCNSRLAPAAPPGEDPPETTLLPLFAFESMRIDTIGAADAGGPIPLGLDLDHTCTCPEVETCVRPRDAGKECDGPRGEDNALGALFNSLNSGIQFFPHTFATDRIHNGFFTIFVEVLGWNGQPNDPRVSVTLRSSQYMDRDATDGGRQTPAFDGNDIWTVSPDSIQGGDGALGKDCRLPGNSFDCLARVRDDKAFVRDGVLVARPRATADGPVPIEVRSSEGSIELAVYDFTVVAALKKTSGGSYRLDGEVSGRVSSSNLVSTFGNLQDFTNGEKTPICQNPPVFAISKAAVCTMVDLAAPGKDGTGAPCNFLSVGMSFGASAAIAGTVLRKDNGVLPCGDASLGCD